MKCPLIPCTHFLSENLNEKTSEDATMCTFWFAAKSQPQFVQKRNLDLNSASRLLSLRHGCVLDPYSSQQHLEAPPIAW